ncbi:hypothetical protein [Naasia sp. SYSU D00948]|uniref:hypothetical protein n=1 Tax=Naasia sp. SYSU D00948 TaxID=2817379 RepID=UPI001B3065EA|nr:hypothetical protein [Naasia sp. SYSU D00948]
MTGRRRGPVENVPDVALVGSVRRAWTPLGLLLAIPAPALFATMLIPADTFATLWGQAHFFRAPYDGYAILNLTLVLFVAFVLQGLLRRTFAVSVSPDLARRISRATTVLAVLTFAAYAAWILIALIRGLTLDVVIAMLQGQPAAMYVFKQDLLVPVSGVTTWTQLGPVLLSLLIIEGKVRGSYRRRVILALLVLVVLRSYFNSERLALVEVVVAGLITLATLAPTRTANFDRVSVAAGAYATGWAGLAVFFGAWEASRSWAYHASSYQGTLVDFSLQRMFGYYATAFNNGALMTSVSAPPDLLAVFPVLGLVPQLGERLQSSSSISYLEALTQQSNPEFNNPSGLLVADAAFGPIGGAALVSLTVLGVMLITVLASSGSVAGLVAYSSTAVGVLELARIYYFGDSRFLPVVIALVVLALYLRREKPAKRARPTPRTGRLPVLGGASRT